MKREPQSLTVHLRHAAHRIHRAAWMIDSGATALHCGRVLALTRRNTGKIRKLFFSDSMALEDRATVLRRNLSASDRQQAIRTERFGAEIEKLGEMARRLRAKLENCYVKIKRYTVSASLPPVMTFSFIDPGFESMDRFKTHLDAYLTLFTKLSQLRFYYVATRDTNFERAKSCSTGHFRGFGTRQARVDCSIISERGERGTRRITASYRSTTSYS